MFWGRANGFTTSCTDIASLERNYLLVDDDLDLIGTRRRPENRLGLALHIALLRHPGQGWHDDTEPPAPLVVWLAEQIEVPFPSLARYGSRGATRSNHRRLAVRHLGLRTFVPAHNMRTAMDLAARAAFDTDDGRIILARLSGEIKAQRFVLPSADTLERIGLAGRARASRLSAQALNDALGDERKKALEALLEHDPGIGRSRLTWLRTPPCSTPSCTMSIPAASPTTSSPCSTCSAFRLLLVCATFRIVGWRASADPGGGRSSPPSWASRSTRRSCSSTGTTPCG